MANTPSKKMEMDSQEEKIRPKELTIEQMLPLIGEKGLFQKLLVIGFTTALFGTSMQPVIVTFITLTPDWKCVEGSTVCPWHNTTFSGKDERRCNMSRTEWKYTVDEEHFSVVTQFQLDCERKSIITLIMAIFYVGFFTNL